jgi:hypothetical protein
VGDVGLQVGQPHRLDRAFAKEDEAVGIVLVVALAVAVGQPTVEKFLAADEVDREVAARVEDADLAGVKPVAHLDLEGQLAHRGGGIRVFEHGAIARQKHRDFMPLRRQGGGQRPDGVRQPAGLHVGKQLAGYVNYLHRENYAPAAQSCRD